MQLRTINAIGVERGNKPLNGRNIFPTLDNLRLLLETFFESERAIEKSVHKLAAGMKLYY